MVATTLMCFNMTEHVKALIDFLYLESGAIPAKFVLSTGRLNYLEETNFRNNHELIKREK